MNNYTPYHMHDYTGSILDTCTNFNDYIALAVENNITSLASTNHGYIFNWTEKKQNCDKAGIKFIHGCEVYLTSQLYHNRYNEATGEKEKYKIRDNYHTILLAKNQDGIKELNKICSLSTDDEHFYYKPRITFDEFFNLSSNIISTSACLASPLRNYTKDTIDYNGELFEKLLNKYDYYEIQMWNCKDQIEYNKWLYDVSKKYNKPLIAGTDTHSSSLYKSECRSILQISKGIEFNNEDSFDLSFKTYDELTSMFDKQNAIPKNEWLEAIENTNVMADSIDDFKLDTSTKYPILNGSEQEDAKAYIDLVHTKFEEKVDKGIIPQDEIEEYKKDIEEELTVFKKTNMLGFMLSMSDIISEAKNNGVPFGPSRGSAMGSRCAFITDITDVDPVKWHGVFSRFCNEDRIEIGDIDVDTPKRYRPQVYSQIFNKFGIDKVAYVLALGTISEKGTIDDIGRALATKWSRKNPDKESINNPYNLNNIKRIKEEYDNDKDKCIKKYKDIFYYFDGLKDTVVSISQHAAGIIISPIDIISEYGVIYNKGNQLFNLDMDAAHDIGVCKYDILGVKTVDIIKRTCEYIGIEYPHTYNFNFNDQETWSDILRAKECLFQFSSDFAFGSLKKFKPTCVDDITLVTAVIRPGASSFREELLGRNFYKTPSEQIDNLLKSTYGRLLYQESTIAFLKDICGLSGGKADTVRRAIGHKDKEAVGAMLPQILNGYCNVSDKPREVAEQEAKEFLKVIEDSSFYQFGYNHSVGYSIFTYYCAYFRCHYPAEFIVANLNCAETESDIVEATKLAKVYNIKIIEPTFRHSKAEYFYDKSTGCISKGMKSIKYLNQSCADDLYGLKNYTYNGFINLLYDTSKIQINERQLEILIKLDFFKEFGNAKELLRILDLFNYFKHGDAKTIKKTKIQDKEILYNIIKRFSIETDKSFIKLQTYNILMECEKYLKCQKIEDFPLKDKILDQLQYLGYINLCKNTDDLNERKKLIVLNISPLMNKFSKEKSIWKYRINTQSLGSGKQGTFFVYPKQYEQDPISQYDIIFAQNVYSQNGYWNINQYYHI